MGLTGGTHGAEAGNLDSSCALPPPCCVTLSKSLLHLGLSFHICTVGAPQEVSLKGLAMLTARTLVDMNLCPCPFGQGQRLPPDGDLWEGKCPACLVYLCIPGAQHDGDTQ